MRLGLDHLAQTVAVAVQDVRHRAGRGKLPVAEALQPQLLQGFRRRQAGVRQRRAEGGILLGMRLRQRKQGSRHFGMPFLPEQITAKSWLRPHADHAGAPFMQPQLDGVASPAEDTLRLAGAAPAMFVGHRRQERPAFGAQHLGARQFKVFNLGGAQWRGRIGGGRQGLSRLGYFRERQFYYAGENILWKSPKRISLCCSSKNPLADSLTNTSVPSPRIKRYSM